ncbi:MAG: hypothetical protein HC899_09820 [Leptolyngbyaceae cyanobacterium SM1_4_3]|nr:hypothetical protein [Leptolyngbyaceae cyanobacterium SM1_4_3]
MFLRIEISLLNFKVFGVMKRSPDISVRTPFSNWNFRRLCFSLLLLPAFAPPHLLPRLDSPMKK